MKKLYLLRHAKSDWHAKAASDFERPLNKRGRNNARAVGHWMASQRIVPDLIISSPALRAWQTSTFVCAALGIDSSSIQFNSNLYLADIKTLLSCIKNVPADSQAVMLVGHNPGMEELLAYLAGDSVHQPDDGKLLPTATLASLGVSTDWSALSSGVTELAFIRRPK